MTKIEITNIQDIRALPKVGSLDDVCEGSDIFAEFNLTRNPAYSGAFTSVTVMELKRTEQGLEVTKGQAANGHFGSDGKISYGKAEPFPRLIRSLEKIVPLVLTEEQVAKGIYI